MTHSIFDYDPEAPVDSREVSTYQKDGAIVRNFTYASHFYGRRAAYFVRPETGGPFPIILFVHWYEPESPDSNRTQFLEEARSMAQRGVASLLIETMWSDRDWFLKRTQDDDYSYSIRQVIELRQAMDILVAQENVDTSRFAYVGHDFGAMYGVVMGSVDPRPSCYVLMAGTPRLPDWYLYYPELKVEKRQAYLESMDELDPINHVANLSPAPLLFQFGDDDIHLPEERALDFFEAAGDPKAISWYNAGHGLNAEATNDRIAWLEEQLKLAPIA